MGPQDFQVTFDRQFQVTYLLLKC